MTKAEALRDMITAWILAFGDRTVTGTEYTHTEWYVAFLNNVELATGPDVGYGWFDSVDRGWVVSQKGLDLFKGEDL